MPESQHRLAVLIDADNAQPAIIEGLMSEVARYGIASVKRIYGDWTKPNLGGWKELLLEHSIQPMQQFAYTNGKNATDSALIIDAMDLLYTHRFNGFCLVSSDSDFTRLAARIREEGLKVYGFGEQKTPSAFVSACDKFIYTEVLRPKSESGQEPLARRTRSQLRGDTKLVNLLRGAVEAASDDSGWAFLGAVGSHIAKQAPEFDSRNYGYAKLGDLVEATELFQVERRGTHIHLCNTRTTAQNDLPSPTAVGVAIARKAAAELNGDARLVALLREAVAAVAGADGWAELGPMGTHLHQREPHFSPTHYGYEKLKELLKATELFELTSRQGADGQASICLARESLKLAQPHVEEAEREPNPQQRAAWQQFAEQYHQGQQLYGVVAYAYWVGVIVRFVGQEQMGLVHRSNLPPDYQQRFTEGDRVRVVVTGLKPERCQVELKLV